MATVRVYGKDNAGVSWSNKSTHYGPTALFSRYNFGANDLLLQSFGELPDVYKYSVILDSRLHFYFVVTDDLGTSASSSILIYVLGESFNPSSVTYATAPGRMYLGSFSLSTQESGYIASANLGYSSIPNVLDYGVALTETFYHGIYTSSGSYPPYLELTFGETAAMNLTLSSPVGSAFANQALSTTFVWAAAQSSKATIVPVALSSAKIRWRKTGTSTVHEIPVGAVTSYSVPAGTFPAGSIDWQIEATANSGVVTTTAWQTVSVISPRIVGASPVSGAYVPKFKPSIFSWSTQHIAANGTATTLTQKSAVFRWRVTGTSSVRTVSVGSSASVTIPAGTFTEDSIDWQVETVTDSGVSTTSSWYTVSTLEPKPSARPLSPKNTTVDGSEPVVFSWEHITESGTAQTAFDLQTSVDGSYWTTIEAAASSVSSCVIPAGVLSGGELFWRVRTYNTDDVPSDWSASARILVIAAPAPPSVVVEDAAPRFTIRWQQSGQQAYEVRLNGKVIARRFGTVSNYTYTDYLDPGEYMVDVRIQNSYGLWSKWGSASLSVENISGAAIGLTVTSGEAPALVWGSEVPYSQYWVYRDGKLLAKTTGGTYVDYFAVGDVVYSVRGVYADSGNYTLSNSVHARAECNYLMISRVESPQFIRLRLSERSLCTISESMTRGVSYVHVSGAALPRPIVGEEENRIVQFSCAFPKSDVESAESFEKLLGETVCLKAPKSKAVFGVIGSMNRSENAFYRSYTVSLTRIDYEEAEA